MLERLRSGVRSWVAQALLAMLVVSFAIWGMGDVTRGFSTKVATVGDQSVEADVFAAVLRNETQRYGIDPSQIRATGLDRFVLSRLVREAALDEATTALGVSAPDEAVAATVREQPAFQVNGKFDPAQYAAAVRRTFSSISDYEETVRRGLAASVLQQAAAQGATAPLGAGRLIATFRQEARRFETVTLDAAAHAEAPAAPTDADLQALLDADRAAFADPERRDVTYLALDLGEMAASAPIPEDELRAAWEERRDALGVPERREIDQIVFPTAEEAAAARARLDAGESFEALLVERGLSLADASLGAVSAADIGAARADAAFALPAPGVAGPVEIPTGHALLAVRTIEPGVEVPFEAVRDDLRRELGADRVRPEADRLSEAIEDARAAGASIEEAATELGLAAVALKGLAADGSLADGAAASGVAADPAFLAEAFEAAAGEERDILRLPDGSWVALRVDAVAAPPEPTVEAKRPALVAAWEAAERLRSVEGKAEAARGRLAAGETLAAVAESFGVAVEPLGPLRRDEPDPRIGPDARAALFAAEPGAAAVTVWGDSVTLAVLAAIEPPSALDAAAAEADRALAESVAQDQLELLGRAYELRFGAGVNQQVVDSVLSQIGG